MGWFLLADGAGAACSKAAGGAAAAAAETPEEAAERQKRHAAKIQLRVLQHHALLMDVQ